MRHLVSTLITAPTVEPVTTTQAKAHCRVTESAEDSQFEAWITVARKKVETVTRRQLITATWEMGFDAFPCSDGFVVLRAPLQSVTSLKYIDTAGDEQTVDSSVYTVETTATPGIVRLAYNQSWPVGVREEMRAVRLRFVAGYGDAASDVPEELILAIKILVDHYYNNRSLADRAAENQIVPELFDALLWPYRVLTGM